MERYVFYDPSDGRVLHTHAVVTSEDTADTTAAVDDAELATMVERMVDVESAKWTLTEVEPLSSRAAEQYVDPKSKRLTVKRIRRSASREQRRAETSSEANGS